MICAQDVSTVRLQACVQARTLAVIPESAGRGDRARARWQDVCMVAVLGAWPAWTDLKDSWRIKGDDGRPYESFTFGSYDLYHGVNYGHPEVQDYYLEWIRRYIREYKIEGIFWDCGGVPFPPDFSDPTLRPFQRFPSESMTATYRFMEKVMQVGRECSPNFFMWHECFSKTSRAWATPRPQATMPS